MSLEKFKSFELNQNEARKIEGGLNWPTFSGIIDWFGITDDIGNSSHPWHRDNQGV